MSAVCFSPPTDQKLDAAASICAARGLRLTSLRRQVLGLVLETGTPASAYDLLDRLRANHKGAAPPTVYRALDFLRAQGLVHKVERLSAYIGCVHAHEIAGVHAHDDEHPTAQFLICRHCGRVAELEDRAIGEAIAAAAAKLGFLGGGSTVEVEGLCAACQTALQSAR